MNATPLDTLVRQQHALIEALDNEDADATVAATQAIERALAGIHAAPPSGTQARAAAQDALRLADLARARVNVLADRTEARVTRMAEATGASAAAPVYGRNARLVRK